jgi:hypothetical protein
MRYRIDGVPTKLTDGNHKFIAQLNEKRKDKRPADDIQSVNQLFDDSGFHFGKISPEEVLFRLVYGSSVLLTMT